MWRRFCSMKALSRCGTSSYDVNWRTPALIFDASNLYERAGVSYAPTTRQETEQNMDAWNGHTCTQTLLHTNHQAIAFTHKNPGKRMCQQVVQVRTWCRGRPWAAATGR